MPEPNELRVWWARHVPITKKHPSEYFPVKNIDEAKKKIKELTEADLKNPKITDNVGGLQIYEDGGWIDYSDKDGRDIDQIIYAQEGNE